MTATCGVAWVEFAGVPPAMMLNRRQLNSPPSGRNSAHCDCPTLRFWIGLTLLVICSLVVPVVPLAPPSSFAPRHVCLMGGYTAVRGPYLCALLDQLVEQAGHRGLDDGNFTMLFCCYYDNNQQDSSTHAQEHVRQLQADMGIADCHILQLREYNPVTLEKRLEKMRPSMIWVAGDNPFTLRYRMRTSGLDRWITRHCAGSSMGTQCVFVGEGAGAICAGASLQIAKSLGRNYDPRVAPEPQFFGLGLIGLDRTVAFADGSTNKDKVLELQDCHSELDSSELLILECDQIYVWSQSLSPVDGATSVASFVFLPLQFGMMEKMTSPQPLLPLVADSDTPGEGVACYGEPSIDPSRQLQRDGDSDWLDDYSGV